MKKTLALILTTLLMLMVTLSFTSCNLNDLPFVSENDENDDEYHDAYNLYVEHAKRNGLEYDDYETWIASIKGEDGKDGEDGVTPLLRINEETNFWEISYDNGTIWTSLDVKATGAQGEKGDKGEQGEKGDRGESATACEHSFSDWEAVYKATCDACGISTRKCNLCEYIECRFDEKKDHTYSEYLSLGKDDTCHTAFKICSACGMTSLVLQEAHDYDDQNVCKICKHEYVAPVVKEETITIWVSGKEGMTKLTQTQIDRFIEANPQYANKYKFQISGVSEADAASQVLADVASAADIYCFSQEYTSRLVQASALLQPNDAKVATIKNSNDASGIAAASVGGTVYAYPMTSDNGYYLYYDKSIISDPSTLEGIIADCLAAEKAGKTNYQFRFGLENAWYTASFFFATGCHSTWTVDKDGEFIAIDDDFNSDAGLIAMKGMHKLTATTIYNSDENRVDATAAWVTGIWNASTAADYYGENLGVCKLPTFTVDGETYQLGSFSGNKLMGVKPQTDSEKAAFLSELALYLTNEECQLERYSNYMWLPSNLEAQKDDSVQSNPSYVALTEQSKFATPLGNVGGSWWDIAKVLGAESKKNTEEEYQKALDDYDRSIRYWLKPNIEEMRAWTVIGHINGTNWNIDIAMTESPTNTWTSDPLTCAAGDEFKVRQGLAWTKNYGADGELNGKNIKVETAGTYKVVFSWDGNGGNVKIELVPVE